MQENILHQIEAALAPLQAAHPVGRVLSVMAGRVQVGGIDARVRIGDRAQMVAGGQRRAGEVIALGASTVDLMLDVPVDGVSIGDRVILNPPHPFAPAASWIGRVIDPDGYPLDGRPLLPGLTPRDQQQPPPQAHQRRAMGQRLETGMAVFNTLLPLARGQRMGLFAGSGVGKSTLLADFAHGVDADVIVIALVGERGREVRHFVRDVLGDDGMARAVVVAATSDRAPQVRRRCALSATAVAEYFRDQGKQVLLL
ncbi:MAG: flagellum-specific ATP synthase FliI, partial [Pseudomonadota bacterium]